jgi:hypothetical protein
MTVNDILNMMNTLHKSDPGTISMSPDQSGRYTPTGLPTISGGDYINPQNQEPVFKGVFGKGSPSTGDVTTTLGNIAEALAPNSWGGRLGGAMARQVGQKEARTLWNTRAREYLDQVKRKKGLLQTQRDLIPLFLNKTLKPIPTETPSQYETRTGLSGIPESNMPTTGEGYAMLQDYLRKNPIQTTSPAEQNPSVLLDIARLGYDPNAKVDFQTDMVQPPYGAMPANVAYHYLQNLKPTDSTTELVNSWSQALFGKGWDSLTQPQKKAVMDKYGLQNPMAIRAVGPPIYYNVPGFQTPEGQPITMSGRTGVMSPAKGAEPGKAVPAPTQNDINFQRAYTSANAIIQELQKRFKDIEPQMANNAVERLTGAPGRYLKAESQSNPALASTQALSEATLSKLIRALGEVGTLTDQDIKRARAAIPSIYDTVAVKNQKIQQLRTLVGEIFQRGRRDVNTRIGGTGAGRVIRKQGNDGNWYVNDGQGWRPE